MEERGGRLSVPALGQGPAANPRSNSSVTSRQREGHERGARPVPQGETVCILCSDHNVNRPKGV